MSSIFTLLLMTQITSTIGGPTYIMMTGLVNQMLSPIDEFANNIQGLITQDPIQAATSVAEAAAVLWRYMSYGSNIAPGFVSIGIFITLFFAVMLIKVIMSLIKYIKQLIAQWV